MKLEIPLSDSQNTALKRSRVTGYVPEVPNAKGYGYRTLQRPHLPLCAPGQHLSRGHSRTHASGREDKGLASAPGSQFGVCPSSGSGTAPPTLLPVIKGHQLCDKNCCITCPLTNSGWHLHGLLSWLFTVSYVSCP